MSITAILALEDGSVFKGTAIGAAGQAVGEVVFNTSMTGYQEILTDPSYANQIVTLTYPHVGSYGVNSEDEESRGIFAKGLVIRDLPLIASNFRSEKALDVYLKEHNILAIADIDTRRLTRILREKGSLNGCIVAVEAADTNSADKELASEENLAKAIATAKDFPGLKGMDLAKEVTTQENYSWTESDWVLGKGYGQLAKEDAKYKVVAYDFGVKRNILRLLAERGCDLTVVPAQTPASEVLAMNPDGIFLSNGPGDPEPCTYAIEAIKEILKTEIPVFGICLGHQLLALASGAKTVKMPHGHHGGNHPVQDLESGVVMITSQNHGFAVEETTLPANVKATHKSLFDGTLQGIELTDKPAFSFQGHPEASPGPHDVAPLFDRFIEMIEAAKTASK